MKYCLFLVFLVVFSCAAFAQAPFATGYKDEGFKGDSRQFPIGEYPKLDNWKDDIKSIALTGAVRVSLFDKEKFEGKKVVVEQSLYELGDFKEKAASMIVEPFSCAYAIAYKSTVFRGNSKQFSAGKYEKLSDGWDDMQSIDICGNVTVTLYNKENFAGDSMNVVADKIDLGKFNKKVKSMVVEAAPQTP